MWRWRNLSIKGKLRLVILLTSSAALLLACAALFVYELVSFRRATRLDLATVARIVAANSTAAISFDQPEEAAETLSALEAKEHVLAAGICLTDGTWFAKFSQPGVEARFPAVLGGDGFHAEGGRLALVEPITVGNQRLATLYLEYDYAAKVGELRGLYAGIVTLVLLVSLLLAYVLSARLQRRLAEPILSLVDTARTISANQDYSVRARKLSQDELAPFVDSFNQMLARIQDQDAALRRAKEELEERVKARTHQLSDLQHKLELILNSAGEGIYGLDLEGKITFVNPAAAKMLGWQVADIIGRREHELTRHGSPDGVPYAAEQCPVCAAFRAGQVRRMTDQRFSAKDGGALPVELVCTPIREADVILGAVVVFKNVAERQALETQLRQAQKMESIGRLAAGVAHDFNNILTVIQGHADLLAIEPCLEQQAAASLEEIRHATERAANLTRQLLAFSRKQLLQPRLLDLNSVVLGVTRMLNRLVGEDIELRLDLAANLQPINADVGLLEQVMVNLAVNARDAMPAGGTLTLATSALTVDEDSLWRHAEASPGSYVALTVTDTGCGMDQATLSHLFEPFFTTKEVGKGTGLGLSTVYGIVKQHQGWVEVASEPGRGASFKVVLPASPAPASDLLAPETTGRGLTSGHGTILLVEDELPLRLLVERVLENCGYQVLAAGSGAEALALRQSHAGPVDLVFTDLVMPHGMSGAELARRLRADEPQLKVLYTSGYSAELAAQDLDRQPGVNFLPKPYTPQNLTRVIQQCLAAAPTEKKPAAQTL